MWNSYYTGARECLQHLREPVIAQFSSFLNPPELLDWGVTALYMVVTGVVNAIPWHDKRNSLQQFAEDGRLSCERFHKSMVTLKPDQIAEDVASAVQDLYFEDPRFSTEYMLNSEDDTVAFGLRKSLSFVVQWITNMLACRELSAQMEMCDAELQALEDSEQSWLKAWEAKKVGGGGMH